MLHATAGVWCCVQKIESGHIPHTYEKKKCPLRRYLMSLRRYPNDSRVLASLLFTTSAGVLLIPQNTYSTRLLGSGKNRIFYEGENLQESKCSHLSTALQFFCPQLVHNCLLIIVSVPCCVVLHAGAGFISIQSVPAERGGGPPITTMNSKYTGRT